MRALARAVKAVKTKSASDVEMYPLCGTIMAAQADALLSMGENSLALDLARVVVQYRPNVAGAWVLLARAHVAMANYADALGIIRRAAMRG